MKVVSFQGLYGGLGTTTIAAELAGMLVARGVDVLLLDLSPRNSLRLHFGMAWSDSHGLVPQVLSQKPWNEAAFQCENGVNYLPFGRAGKSEVAAFYALLQRQDDWLGARLSELEVSDNIFVLIDCSGAEDFIRTQAQAVADLVFCIFDASPSSYAELAELQTGMQSEIAHKFVYLLNKFDPTLELDRDVISLLRQELKQMICPVLIHRDESVREALACKLNLHVYAPESQAADDVSTLVTWLIAKLATNRSAIK